MGMHNNNKIKLVCEVLLLLFVICVGSQYSWAQTNPECDDQHASQNDTQKTTTQSPELIPDVTSNICLIMTPDLPGNLATDDLQNSMDLSLQNTNETIETILDDATASNLSTVSENASLVTSPSQIQPASPGENGTIAIQNEIDNKTIGVLDNQSKTPNTNSSINMNYTSNQNISSQITPTNETPNSTVGNVSILQQHNNTNMTTSTENHIPNTDIPSNSTNGLGEDISKTKLKNFTSLDDYSFSYPQDWNLTVYGNDTFIRTDKFNSDYYPLLSIYIQKVDPITINNTQTLSHIFPIENVSSEIINSALNNSKLQSNILLKYYIDLEYDVIEPTQIGKYIIDGKPASSFKVYKSEDGYEREFIIVIIDDKIFNIEINIVDSMVLEEDAFEIEQSKQQLIDSIKWTNVTNKNITVSKTMDQEIVNDNVTETNEIKSSFSSSEDDLNITSSTHFFDDDDFKIVGEVLNNGPENRELVKVIITLYNENNNVIGTELSYTTPSDIFSKQSAPFEIIISQGDVGNVSEIRSYKLFLTSDVEKPSNSRESPSISGTTSAIPDSTSLNVEESSTSNLTSSNPLDMLRNLFKDTNSTISSNNLQNDFTRDNLPTNIEANSNPVQLTDNIVEASIVSGASVLTDKAYNPNPIEINMGQTVMWTNDDTAFHTITSGTVGAVDAGKIFDSGLVGASAMTSKGKTFEHTFTEAGEYPYFCILHPAMVGKVTVR